MLDHTPTQHDQLYTCACGFRAVWTTRGLVTIAEGEPADHVAQILAQRAEVRAYAEALCRRLESTGLTAAQRRRLGRLIIAEYIGE